MQRSKTSYFHTKSQSISTTRPSSAELGTQNGNLALAPAKFAADVGAKMACPRVDSPKMGGVELVLLEMVGGRVGDLITCNTEVFDKF